MISGTLATQFQLHLMLTKHLQRAWATQVAVKQRLT
jgi:hypothetical protein